MYILDLRHCRCPLSLLKLKEFLLTNPLVSVQILFATEVAMQDILYYLKKKKLSVSSGYVKNTITSKRLNLMLQELTIWYKSRFSDPHLGVLFVSLLGLFFTIYFLGNINTFICGPRFILSSRLARYAFNALKNKPWLSDIDRNVRLYVDYDIYVYCRCADGHKTRYFFIT